MTQELRDACRSLLSDRAFAVLAALLLALTIGATTAVYAIVEAVVLRPLPFPQQDRVVVIWASNVQQNHPVIEVALGEMNGWAASSRSFDAAAVFGSVNWTMTIVEGDVTSRVPYSSVSATFFDVSGVEPMLGRVFDASDDTGIEMRSVVLGHDFWMTHFGGDRAIVGRSMMIREQPEAPSRAVEIVGVMPEGFEYPRGAAFWLPAAPAIRAAGAAGDSKDSEQAIARLRVFYGLGRLRESVTVSSAQQELSAIMSRLETNGGGPPPSAVLQPIDEYLLGSAKPVLWTLLAGAVLMLVIACTNIAALHVFRAARQDRALAIRLAIGASRLQLVRLVVYESALLASVALIGAGAVAWSCSRLLVAAAPIDVPRLSAVTLASPGVFALAFLFTFLTVTLCGIWPALFAGRVDAAAVLAHGARAAAHPRERRLQQGLVIAQVAIAVLLLTGTALFAQSVRALDRMPLGFDANNLASLRIEPDTVDLERRDAYYEQLLERLTAVPGILDAGVVYLRPLSGPIGNDTIPLLEGQTPADFDSWRNNPRANLEAATPTYFRTMGTRLMRGRWFEPTDTASAPGVVIVSESAAARYWPGQDPIGQPILVVTLRGATREQPRWQRVVGVVQDMRYRGVVDPRLDIYLPARQTRMFVKDVMVRTTADPIAVTTTVRAIARELDPHATIANVTTMADVVAAETAPWRFAMRVMGAFGILAAVLATIGLGASISLVVTLRRRELGIRAALGAHPRRLRRSVLAEGLQLAAVGTILGLALSAALGQGIGGLLIDIQPHDPIALGSASAIALIAVMMGCLWPAHRAATIDPAEALKDI